MDHDIIILPSALIANRLPYNIRSASSIGKQIRIFPYNHVFLKMDIVLGKKIVDIHGKNYRYSTKNYRYF